MVHVEVQINVLATMDSLEKTVTSASKEPLERTAINTFVRTTAADMEIVFVLTFVSVIVCSKVMIVLNGLNVLPTKTLGACMEKDNTSKTAVLGIEFATEDLENAIVTSFSKDRNAKNLNAVAKDMENALAKKHVNAKRDTSEVDVNTKEELMHQITV